MTTTLKRPGTLLTITAAAAAALCTLQLWTSASPAQAHSELTSSTPAAKARLTASPQAVKLVFSDEVEPRFTNVALTVGTTKPVALKPEVDGRTVTAPIPDQQRAPGAWKVSYRVVSADGHPISGTIAFTVTPTPPSPTPTSPRSETTTTPVGTPTATEAPHPEPAPARSGDRMGSRPFMLMLAAVIALMAALAYAVWRSGKGRR